MPIFIDNRDVFILQKHDFHVRYSGILPKKESMFSEISVDDKAYSTFLSRMSVHYRTIEKLVESKDGVMISNKFDFHGGEAQELILELILFFSAFYIKLDVLTGRNSKQNISEYILPHLKDYISNGHYIVVKQKKIEILINRKKVNRVIGIPNNFLIFHDQYIIHFCKDVFLGKFIKLIPISSTTNYFEGLRCFDYIFERNKPSKYRLNKYRIDKRLIISE